MIKQYSSFFHSPIGTITVLADEHAVQVVSFSEKEALGLAENEPSAAAADQLRRYFEGSLQEFNFPMQQKGTDFQQNVWKSLLEIPYGSTTSYAKFSEQMNNILAIRAIAAANGKNNIAIVVPCHRVIGSSGKLPAGTNDLKILNMNAYLDIALRSLAVYVFMLVAIRLTGKKELSQLNTTDVVLILLISNAVQNAMVGSDSSLLGGLCAAAVLFLLNFFLKKVMFKNRKLRDLILQKPQILIHDGKLDFDQLSRLDITNEELQEAIREHGVDRYRDVKLAILEADGNISVISGDGNLKHTQYKRKKKRKALGGLN
eukprot:gene15198-18377_t